MMEDSSQVVLTNAGRYLKPQLPAFLKPHPQKMSLQLRECMPKTRTQAWTAAQVK